MEYTLEVFLAIFLLIFGLGLFIAGIFTVYFGSGKSRGIGAGLLAGGIILGLLVVIMFYLDIFWEYPAFELWDSIIYPGLVYLGAALLGVLAAVGLFLLAIMKS